jgi:SpoVK/Ycf46/Vps4 family AAA+-type ATPase
MTSNAPWYLGRSIRRRIDREVYVPLPDAVRRLAMLRNEVQMSHEDYSLVADLSEGMDFWGIRCAINMAGRLQASGEADEGNRDALIEAFRLATPGIDAKTLERFQTYIAEHSY